MPFKKIHKTSSSTMDATIIHQVLSSKPQLTTKRYAYGTAGFRDRYEETMHHLFVRVGILAALRSIVCQGKCTGVMVTASHNTEEDNGVKIVDIDGGMLVKTWEVMAEKMANDSIDNFIQSVEEILANQTGSRPVAIVMIGQDTRWHSAKLVECVVEGVHLLGGQVLSIEQVITPVLHFCVNDYNLSNKSISDFSALEAKQIYYKQLHEGYCELLQSVDHSPAQSQLLLDTAYGVGSITVLDFLSSTRPVLGWEISVVNKAGEGSVNADCGAEHVQKLQTPPTGIAVADHPNTLFCSFDGDGDRIVFHGMDKGKWILLDGDRIASLVATFLLVEVKEAQLLDQLTIGIIQTAYANGGSTTYLRSQGISVVFAKTGVKYLHHAAQALDIGIYFEANGHGTVIFSDKAKGLIHSQDVSKSGDSRKALALRRLQGCLKVINQTVGDALSDLLLTLATLQVLGIDYLKWYAMYSDLPSRQIKVAVPDKSLLKCSEDEMRLVSPASVQNELDAAMETINQGRCFLRPSGTEDVVRIYVEAEDVEGMNVLLERGKQILLQFYNQ